MSAPLVGIPIKPFGIAKARLSGVLDDRTRSRLGRAIAAHTLAAAAGSGARAVVVTGDEGVARWARRHRWPVVAEPPGAGLDGAAAALVAAAAGRPWAVLHADLPLLVAGDLVVAWHAAATGGPVISPSHDGGTSLVAGTGPFRFSYGPGSFHRHLRSLPSATIVVRSGLALDLDTVADLRVALAVPAGSWLRSELGPGTHVAAHAPSLSP